MFFNFQAFCGARAYIPATNRVLLAASRLAMAVGYAVVASYVSLFSWSFFH